MPIRTRAVSRRPSPSPPRCLPAERCLPRGLRVRGRAQEAYGKPRKKTADDRTGQKALTKLAEMKTGRVVTFPALADLPKLREATTDACADDDFNRPILVTGMCTAMRRGDCCLLKWDDVDLAAGFITVKTAKTG